MELLIKGIYLFVNLTALLYSLYPSYILCRKDFYEKHLTPFGKKYIEPKFGVFGVFVFGIIWLVFASFIFLILFTLIAYLFGFPPDIGDFWRDIIPNLDESVGFFIADILGIE